MNDRWMEFIDKAEVFCRLNRLNKRERRVISALLGIGCDKRMSRDEIAEMLGGVTKGYIWQLERTALRKLSDEPS